MHLSLKWLALLAMVPVGLALPAKLPREAGAAPEPEPGYGNYGKYGDYGAYPPPPPPGKNPYGTYASYGSYKRISKAEAESEAAPET